MTDSFKSLKTITALEALQLLLPDIEKVPHKEIQRPRKSAFEAIDIISTYVNNLRRDWDEILYHFKRFSEKDLELFVNLGSAYRALETKYNHAKINKPSRKEVYREASVAKQKITSLLQLAAGDDPEINRVINITKPGHGYNNRANDLLALYGVVHKRRKLLLSTGLITDKEINRIGRLPILLLNKSAAKKTIDDARILYNKAWTLFVRSYYDIRRRVEFIHYNNPKKLKKYPSLFAQKKKKKRSE